MPIVFAILVGCQLLGEVLREALNLPLPGPVVGMFLLAVALAVRGNDRAGQGKAAIPPLDRAAQGIIANMGLLFVPAGVGVIAEFDVLRQEWLAVVLGILVSTVLSLIVTALVMHWVSRAVEGHRRIPALIPAAQEAQ